MTEARNRLAAYLKKPGAKPSDAAAKGLQGAVVTAQRNSFDLRIQRKATENATISFGIDNVGDTRYTLFHPFPGRTYLADVRIKF